MESTNSVSEDGNNKNDVLSVRKSVKRLTVTSYNSTSATMLKKTSKSAGATDWRLNLQGILPKWEYIFENKLFTDFTFFVGPAREPVKCHSLVLKSQSRYFESVLTPDKLEMDVPLCSPAVFQKVLKYLYTDKLEITAEDALDTLLLARQFHLTTLQSKCGRLVLEGIHVNNAASMLKKADDIGDKQLSLKVQEYILKYASQVAFTPGFKDISIGSLQKLLHASRSLWKMPEVRILEAVKEWASAECTRQEMENTGPNQYAVAKIALGLIHFNQFTPMQFTTQVVKPKLLPNEMMLEIQSQLIEQEESTKGEYTSLPALLSQGENEIDDETEAQESNEYESRPSTAVSLAKSCSEDTVTTVDDIDQVKYDTVHILSRYSSPISKDWTSDNEDGIYKICFNASKSVNIVAFTLYGHGNDTSALVDVCIQILRFDEQLIYLELDTKSELPENGGEFDVILPSPFHLNKGEWYSLMVVVNGRVHPTGTGGKRNYNVEIGNNDSVEFYFKNSKGIVGASHVRGQLPKIHFSVPTNLRPDTAPVNPPASSSPSP